jgi:hypothetical protein
MSGDVNLPLLEFHRRPALPDREDLDVRRVLAGAVVAAAALAAAACGSQSSASTFKPPATTPAASASTAAPPPSPSPSAVPDSIIMPPFGQNAKIVLDPWMPSDPSEVPAVVTAKNFLVAILYADYTGDRDQRWKNYVTSPKMLSDMSASLAEPSISTESWIGTLKFTRFSAEFKSSGEKTAMVSFCEDSSESKNTSLTTGKVLPAAEQSTGNQNYYAITYYLDPGTDGSWNVIGTDPVVYYPRASECKP